MEEGLFFLKKFLGDALMPFPIALLAMIAGMVILGRGANKRWALVPLVASLVLLLLAGMKWPSDYLASSLEDRYRPVLDPAPLGRVDWIVVLSAGQRDDPRVPALGRLGDSTLVRMAEGIRLYRMIPGSRLLFSGGGGGEGRSAIAENMRDAAVELGVPIEDITIEISSMDTADQAAIMAGILKDRRFILVTSAAHMERSVRLFKQAGLDPIPAPAQYMSLEGRGPHDRHRHFVPDARNLVQTDTVLHEFLGMAWTAVRGII
jgi:uncharacterized SAM-binding protein YcdF (DUF218 family)